MKDFNYVLKTSSQLTDTEILDFLSVFNNVFDESKDLEWFKWKYLDNIYGDSYIVIVYNETKAVGARAFWRNDIDGSIAYQPCDTAVMSECRGKGVFPKMTLMVRDMLDEHIIYNFPNENSYPGYIKMGWKDKVSMYLKLVISRKNLYQEAEFIDKEYLVWRFGQSKTSSYYYTSIKNQSYLLFKRSDRVYYVLGRFDPKYNDLFTQVKNPILFSYTKSETFMYKLFKNRSRIVIYDKEDKYKHTDIPMIKGDFF